MIQVAITAFRFQGLLTSGARLWDLDPLRSIPQRHWAPLAPPPSVPRAGLLAPLAGAAWLSFMGLASHLLLPRKRDQSSTPCRLFRTDARSSQHRGQNWAPLLQNHMQDMWACDFLQATDLFFRSLFAFFILDMQSRKVIHVGVTRSPTDAWAAQQLREATPYGQSPKYLIRDRDNKFGSRFARVAATSGITMLTTPYHAKRPNAICERFLGSMRRECLDHLFILQEKQLDRVLHASVRYFNQARPHQGIKQQIPEQYGEPALPDHDGGKILTFPVLGGLHHDYRRSA